MIDPRILIILAILGLGYYVGEQAVAGIKKVDRAIAHGMTMAGKTIAHVFHHPKADQLPQEPPQ